MARVLIVTDDSDVRNVLAIYLHSAGHTILTCPVGDRALSVLRVSRRPLVVVLHSPLTLSDSVAALHLDEAAADSYLARHRYVLLAAAPESVQPDQQDLLSHLQADVLDLPFDLVELAAAVERAERALNSSIPLAASYGAEEHA
jgi:DNA-binding response OmpR family regulator